MYVTISPQNMEASSSQSVGNFVSYLEKENAILDPTEREPFFNNTHEKVHPENVVLDIDSNTKKLKKVEPKFYSMVVSPSEKELKKIEDLAKKQVENELKYRPNLVGNEAEKNALIKQYSNENLKLYTNDLMKEYAKGFNREINGKPVGINDIKYYAKIEHTRHYKGQDKEVKENAPYFSKIKSLESNLSTAKFEKNTFMQSAISKEIARLKHEIPHKIEGVPVKQGMQKVGDQRHIHVILSRKDNSNNYSLSPGAVHKSSTAKLNGKTVQRGFNRDQFYSNAEKVFDKRMGYNRNISESYEGKKLQKNNPKEYFKQVQELPKEQRKEVYSNITIQDKKVFSKENLNVTAAESIKNIRSNQVAAALEKKKIEENEKANSGQQNNANGNSIEAKKEREKEFENSDIEEPVTVILDPIVEVVEAVEPTATVDNEKVENVANVENVEVVELQAAPEPTPTVDNEKMEIPTKDEVMEILEQQDRNKGIEPNLQEAQEPKISNNKEEKGTVKENEKNPEIDVSRIGKNMIDKAGRVIMPDELKEAIGKINELKTGKIPDTNISVAELKGYVNDAKSIINTFASTGATAAAPPLKAAQLVVKYATKIFKTISRSSGIEMGI